MQSDGKKIIWPQYINKNLSLGEGRKVSLEIAVKDPTVNDISKALKKLKIEHEVEKDKAYPGRWYEQSGRVKVESDMTKSQLLKEICLKINRK